MRNRRFGIEIECNFGAVGGCYEQREHAQSILKRLPVSEEWAEEIGYDGSGIEVRSPILSGPSGFKELKLVMNSFAENGGRTNAADGMHIHHDAPEFVEDVELAARLVRSWVNNENLIKQFVAKNRHNNSMCRSNWNDTTIGQLLNRTPNRYWYNENDKTVYSPVDRGALNIGSLSEHGSIEIRLHEGTLDYEKSSAWIRFGQAMINDVLRRKNPIVSLDAPEELLKRIRVPKVATDKLLATAGVHK